MQLSAKPIRLKYDGTPCRVEWSYDIPTKGPATKAQDIINAVDAIHAAQAMFSLYYGEYHGPVFMDTKRIKGQMGRKGHPATPGKLVVVLRWRGTNQMADRLRRIDSRFHRTRITDL